MKSLSIGPPVRKLRLIIKREYLTRVKTKGFIIGTILVPLLGVAFCLLIIFLVRHKPSQTMRLVVVDNSGTLAQPITHNLDGKLENGQPEFTIVETMVRPASPDAVQQDLRSRINSEKIDAYLWIPADGTQSFELHMRNPDNFALIGPLSGAVDQAVISARLSDRGVHLDDIKAVLRGTDLQLLKVSEAGESVEKGQSIGIAIALVILLYTALLMYGIITMRSVLEEKTTRTMEVLISAVSPFELLCGKILGVAAAAFTQFAIWMISTALLFSYGALAAAGMGTGSALSGVHIPISLVLYAGIFFFGGYFLYSAMFAAIGSACSNEQDAQQLQWIAMAPLVFCMVIYSLVLNDPSSTTSVVLSEIPFFSPVLMALRISLQTPPFWQIALALVLLFLTTIVSIYASAKIYRVGILMYGKRPSVVEMFRWLRYS
ncbi:MAG TPA: ABC transporter permease [Candidatus Acidoferrales bacterium]|nr:ABC transporter permease [Candidatus Acidoferrales bacterium]